MKAVAVESAVGRPEYRGAADRLSMEALLRCWIREHRVPRPDGDVLSLDLGSDRLRIPVEYWSPTGLHRLGAPTGVLGPLSHRALARLLAEAAGAAGDKAGRLERRVAESAARITGHLAARAAEPGPAPSATPFLIAEQGLLAGHPLHPTPKSRDALSDSEAALYSPELRGCFPLHWFAAEPELAAHDSELGPSAADLAIFLSGLTPDGRALVPAHPWQSAELLRRPGVKTLIEAGRLEYLGAAGPAWYPTSSLRTVYRPDRPVMLKLSLGLRVIDSRRENLHKELLRGIEAHRLLSGQLGGLLLAAHPGFRVLTDAAYLAIDAVAGLDVSFRHSPFQATDYVYCVGALTDLGRGSIAPDGHPHELAAHLRSLAGKARRPLRETVFEWFVRYVMTLIAPLLWLDAEHGVTLEAHQQNTLIQLDGSGFPRAGWYRDNQGFRYRASRVAHLEAVSGISALGRASGSVLADDIATERLLHHVGIDNLLGMVGALGCAGLADERELLGAAADLLAPLGGHRPVDLLLGAATLRCGANLLAGAADFDELIGRLETRSVYVEIPNPLAARGKALVGGAP
jgi:siderophore synthetase component